VDGAVTRARAMAARVKPAYLSLVEEAAGDVEMLRGNRDAAVAAYRRADESNPHC